MTKFVIFIKKPVVWVLLVVVVVGVWYGFFRSGAPDFETEVVRRATVSEIVSGTGAVSASQELDLSFEVSGVIAGINTQEGARVAAGAVLATLNRAAREADLASAEAAWTAARARLSELEAGLSPAQEVAARARLVASEVALENTRRTLLSSDIGAYLTGGHYEDGIYSYTPPTISGSYQGDQEGEYVLALYASSAGSGYSFRFTGLEMGLGEVSTVKPQAIGSSGLFIQFPSNFARGSDVEWTIEIPNTRSAQYLANKRAYDLARSTYDQAKADYDLAISGSRPEQIAAAEAAVKQAAAGVNAARVALSRLAIVAPFDGFVRSIPVKVGQTVAPGSRVISLISLGENFVTLYVPEVDIAHLEVGDRAAINFNAFPDELFEATVVYVSPAAEVRDGVTVFKTDLHFTEPDPRVRVGMSAEVDIYTAERQDALSVPGRAIIRSEGRTFVRVSERGEVVERPVELGLRGADGQVEILSGLSEGDRVVTFYRR